MNMILQAIFNHGHKQKLNTAIIVDGVQHTYRDLYDDVVERVQGIENDNCITSIINGKHHIIFIDTKSVYEQLILWLAALHCGYIPIVSHPHMDNTYRSRLMCLHRYSDRSAVWRPYIWNNRHAKTFVAN